MDDVAEKPGVCVSPLDDLFDEDGAAPKSRDFPRYGGFPIREVAGNLSTLDHDVLTLVEE